MILFVLLPLLFSSCLAEEEVLTALYNPAFPPPLVEPHEPTGDDYFADAVFIGDSMMEYVEMLGELPTANYVWNIGMGAASAKQKQFRVKNSDQRLNAYEMAATYAPKKLYILLGSNGLDHLASTYIIADYEQLADELITSFPDALIYVIAPPPMSRKRMTGDRYVPVKRYANFAEELKSLAERRHFYYIDLYHLLVDEDGYLPGKYDSGDGYHLSNRAYSLLIQEARQRTVDYPGIAEEQGGTP